MSPHSPSGDTAHPAAPTGTLQVTRELRFSPHQLVQERCGGTSPSAGRVFQPGHPMKCSSTEQKRHARNTGTLIGALHHSADTRSGGSSPPLLPDLGRGGRVHANTEGAPGSSLGWPSGHQQTRTQAAPHRLLCNIYHGITYPDRYPIPNRTVNKYIHGEEGKEMGTNWLMLKKGLLIIFFFPTNFFPPFLPAFTQKAGTSPSPDPLPFLQLSPVPITLGSIPPGERELREKGAEGLRRERNQK